MCTLKSPRIVPGEASAGFVSPTSMRDDLTTLCPSHTCERSDEFYRMFLLTTCAQLLIGPYHRNYRARGHVVKQARVKGFLLQRHIMLS